MDRVAQSSIYMQAIVEGDADSEWYDSLRTTHSKIAKRKLATSSPTRASKRAAGSQ